eukprot:5727896-Pleurochrysis_carterae.AAC.1
MACLVVLSARTCRLSRRSYGIPNMKLSKETVQRRVDLMAEEGINFVTGVEVRAPLSRQTPMRHTPLKPKALQGTRPSSQTPFIPHVLEAKRLSSHTPSACAHAQAPACPRAMRRMRPLADASPSPPLLRVR